MIINKYLFFLFLILYPTLFVVLVHRFFGCDTNTVQLPQTRIDENNNPIQKQVEILKNYDDFTEFFLSYLTTQNSLPKKSRKYLVFVAQTWFGWGNTIRALGSAFLFSLLSDRIFLIDWKHKVYHLDSIIKDPFKNLLHDPTDPVYSSGWWYDKSVHGEISEIIDVLDSGEFILQGNYAELNKTVLGITSFSPFWRAIQRNPNYAVFLRKIFGFNTIAPLVRFLIRPNSRIQVLIDNMRDKFGKNFVLGVQLRTKNLIFRFDEDSKIRFLKCVNVTLDYMNKGEDNWLSRRPGMIYLSTDDQQLLETWKGENNILLWDGNIQHVGNFNDAEKFGDSKGNSEEEFDKVFLDWYMIGETDILLSSHCSSFGETAFLRGTPQTYFLPSSNSSDTNCGYTFGWPRWCSKIYENY